MFPESLNELSWSAVAGYSLGIPSLIALVLSLLLLPTLLRGGRTLDGGRACFYVMAESFGILLMALGGLPTLMSVLARVPLLPMTYASLLFTFVIGGLVFLRHDHMLHQIEPVSRAVPQTVMFFTWKLIGLLFAVLGFLYVLIYVLTNQSNLQGTWWAVPVTSVFFGILLLWATSHDGTQQQSFAKTTVHKKVVPAKTKKK